MPTSRLIGIDIGSTKTKLWGDGLDEKAPSAVGLARDLASTADHRPFTFADAQVLAAHVSHLGYSRCAVTGVGARTFASEAARWFESVAAPTDNLVDHELRAQVRGARLLAAVAGAPLPEKFLLVGIGTGTSYSFVDGDAVRRFPFGNSLGGGFIAGVAANASVPLDEIGRFCTGLGHRDLLMKDTFPELADGLLGEFVIASFGKVDFLTSRLDVVRTAIKTVAAVVARDLLLFSMLPDWKVEGPVVVVGTPIERMPSLREWLTLYCGMLGAPLVVVPQGSHAAARGAYEQALSAKT